MLLQIQVFIMLANPTLHSVWKNIPNIIDCQIKKRFPIFIIFLAQQAIKCKLNIPSHPMSVSARLRENRTNKIWVEMNRNTSKSIPNIINCDLKKNWQILIIFPCKHFWHYLASNDRSISHLNLRLLLHYMGKPKPAKQDKNAIFCWFPHVV